MKENTLNPFVIFNVIVLSKLVSPTMKGKEILVIDSSDTIHKLLDYLPKVEGLKITTICPDDVPEEAPKSGPNIIFLDIYIAHYLKEWRQIECLRDIPAVIVGNTVYSRPFNQILIDRLLHYTAHYYLSFPVKTLELYTILGKLLGSKKT